MLRIFRDRHGPRSSGQEVQVVDIVPWTSHHRVVSLSYQHGISITNFQSQISRGSRIIEVLKSKAPRISDSVVVNFIQINFGWRVVDIMFMRGIARPVSARSIDLHHNQTVCWKIGTDNIDNLARGVLTTAQAAGNIFWSNELGFKAGF